MTQKALVELDDSPSFGDLDWVAEYDVPGILSLLVLLVQKYKYWLNMTCLVYSIYLLHWYKSTNTGGIWVAEYDVPGILSLLVLLVQKYKY